VSARIAAMRSGARGVGGHRCMGSATPAPPDRPCLKGQKPAHRISLQRGTALQRSTGAAARSGARGQDGGVRPGCTPTLARVTAASVMG